MDGMNKIIRIDGPLSAYERFDAMMYKLLFNQKTTGILFVKRVRAVRISIQH